ncbi:multiple inositol polyphosphate phosphatase 1 [Episyrphus balteatus]|uniref:multiple inositol polyphosphate phosphatase 1 n=1 Tax=Episyrphus balteatus TaxID=286459 RepID=UPI002484E991|nr:multiple inositol polyphosphate phosphatase 1 [Episyrphus balteatus]
MRDVVRHIRQRTQLDDITPQDAHLMYTICAFETAWNKHKKVSPWCSVFNRKTLHFMEFAEDLEYYWIDGYGYDITHKQACPAIIDMFDHIDPKSVHSNATFYFTHSGTMLKLLAHLGLYKDEQHLTHMDATIPRHWRTSAIDAFASNLAFILYECSDGPKVLTLHQERVVRLPGCPKDKDLCSLKEMRRVFRNSIERCNFNEMCDIAT